ncbi:MAG: N-acetylglucosamine-6-phosphate deacetylase [Rubripirellula sp.]
MAGFFDLQVNGYAGVDFNGDQFDEEEMIATCRRLADDGNDKILATIITAPMNSMVARIRRIVELIDRIPEVASIIGGVHVEGPFISPVAGFVGAHPVDAVRPASIKLAKQLLDAGNGQVRLVTLAPEMDDDATVTRMLTDEGVVVAAGHTDASIDQLRRGIDQGVKLFTHLGNGCPGQLTRHDNIIQRVLHLSDDLMVSFIADGHHVPAPALSNYLKRVPNDNIVIVTDAISAAGLGPGRYELADQVVEVDEDGAAWAECRTHFAGCAATFPRMIEILKTQLDVSDADIQQWLSVNPARLMA